MITGLNRELLALQNPALGAGLLWRSVVAYCANRNADPMPLPAVFLILPMLLHKETSELIATTRKSSGLRKFSEKFRESGTSKTDLLLALNRRAIELRELSMDSLQMAIAKRLLNIDLKAGGAFPVSVTRPHAGIPDSISNLFTNAERLGYWFSEVELFELSVVLDVNF